ncbi:hypothetical protein GCM10009584_05720 [Ornithinimicrobium humiphilum]|uniref:Uncharacterized protein n=1 Tax=Ornithinimicrobium humiphilum TaxID=125288 RepID=A0A543KPU1_9MICO|nr:zf-HC2 domain-containing protein [Ornithinimicrobium humiphilum]TQM97086.1 hypothetical protein FB476_1986 [Ornithinimicrobium humiphilum]
MSTHAWHVDDASLTAYSGGTAAPVLAASVEAHLLGCAGCRDRLAAQVDPGAVEAAWARLADHVDRPTPGPLERLGLPPRLARSAVATPVMVLSALAAVALLLMVPVLATVAGDEAALLTLLVVAPLAPVAAAGLAYRDLADPAGEISLATPSSGLRLVAARAVVVSGGALALAVAGLLLAGPWVELSPRAVLSWCLPGVALSTLVLLAGTTRLDPLRVATTLAAAWAALVITGSTVRRALRPDLVLDVLASPATQYLALAVALVAAVLTVARRDTVSYRRTA